MATQNQLTGGSLLFDVLKQHGSIRYLASPGGAIMPIYDAYTAVTLSTF